MRVLIVDDEQAFAEPLAQRLELRGIEAAVAGDAETALGMLSRQEWDLVFLDVCLPGMDGVSLLKLLQEHEPRPDVVMLSGATEMSQAVKAMRRGALNDAIKERGCNKLALGHHFDDAVETFLMNLLFTGQIACFKPATYMSRAGVWQIRPMLYLGEGTIAGFVRGEGLPLVPTTCPEDKESKREEIKGLIKRLQADYPDIKDKVFGAMKRLPLDGWGGEEE